MTPAELGDVVIANLRRIRDSSPALDSMFDTLCRAGHVVVVGGAPRDWLHGKEPRDLDVVVDASDAVLDEIFLSRSAGRTRYGGYKLCLDGVRVDLWSVRATWAFSTQCHLLATIENLPRTAFYNADAIAVSATDGAVFECGFTEAFRTSQLSTVFEQNPFPALCAVRGLVLAQRYGLTFGRAVLRYFEALVESKIRWPDLDSAQMSHYGRREICCADVRAFLPNPLASALLSA